MPEPAEPAAGAAVAAAVVAHQCRQALGLMVGCDHGDVVGDCDDCAPLPVAVRTALAASLPIPALTDPQALEHAVNVLAWPVDTQPADHPHACCLPATALAAVGDGLGWTAGTSTPTTAPAAPAAPGTADATPA